MARISVLMGIYNCAPTLQEALDSLYAQTYQDFKIILCDDGSKDDTLKIAEENARLHENVIVIRNSKNIKLAATLNHCLKYADTEYVARMDGDDISVPNRLETLVNFWIAILNMHLLVVQWFILMKMENGKLHKKSQNQLLILLNGLHHFVMRQYL